MIQEIFKLIINYNICTKAQFDTAMNELKAKMSAEIDNIKNTVDLDSNGEISLKEVYKAIKTMFKTTMKVLKSNSVTFWK